MGEADVSDCSVGIYQSTRRHTSDDSTLALLYFPSIGRKLVGRWDKKHKESQEHDRKISSKNEHATKVFIIRVATVI